MDQAGPKKSAYDDPGLLPWMPESKNHLYPPFLDGMDIQRPSLRTSLIFCVSKFFYVWVGIKNFSFASLGKNFWYGDWWKNFPKGEGFRDDEKKETINRSRVEVALGVCPVGMRLTLT